MCHSVVLFLLNLHKTFTAYLGGLFNEQKIFERIFGLLTILTERVCEESNRRLITVQNYIKLSMRRVIIGLCILMGHLEPRKFHHSA